MLTAGNVVKSLFLFFRSRSTSLSYSPRVECEHNRLPKAGLAGRYELKASVLSHLVDSVQDTFDLFVHFGRVNFEERFYVVAEFSNGFGFRKKQRFRLPVRNVIRSDRNSSLATPAVRFATDGVTAKERRFLADVTCVAAGSKERILVCKHQAPPRMPESTHSNRSPDRLLQIDFALQSGC